MIKDHGCLEHTPLLRSGQTRGWVRLGGSGWPATTGEFFQVAEGGFTDHISAEKGAQCDLFTRRMWLSLQSDFQSFFSVFTQISPFFAMFGWKIGVMKKPLGGAAGKSWPNTSLILKKPPS
jgi:hypothetical protein